MLADPPDSGHVHDWSTPVRLLGWIALIVAAGLSWFGVYALIVTYDVGGISGFADRDRMLAYALFILAPLLTFMPIGRLLRIPLYELEAVVAWSTLLFTITFMDPGSHPPMPVLLLVLVSLTMSLATIFTLVSYAVGYRLLTRRSQRYDFLRARREGYLISMFTVGLLLLRMLDVLTIINASLLALIIVLLEIFLLSRGSAPESVSDPAEAQAPGTSYQGTASR